MHVRMVGGGELTKHLRQLFPRRFPHSPASHRGKYVSGDAKSPNASFCGAKSVFPICPVVPLINPQIISIAVNCSFAAMYDASCLMRLDFPVFPVFLIISRFLENRNASSDKRTDIEICISISAGSFPCMIFLFYFSLLIPEFPYAPDNSV